MQACTINRIMFSQLLDMLVAKVKDNIWALFICIPGLDIDSNGLKLIESDADVHALYDLAENYVTVDLEHDKRKKHAGNMFVEELVAWAEEEAKSPYLRSPPLKSRPFRNDMKGRVLFTDMYCAEDEGFEMTPPLNDDEVGKEDLLLYCSDLENDCVNDAAKILEGMSAGKNDASKYVEYTQGVNEGMNEGINEGMNDGMNEGMNDGVNEDIDAANNDLDEQTDVGDHAYQNSESDSDHSDKSFDYLSDGEDELIQHSKRMIQSKVNGTEVPDEVPRAAGDEGTSAEGQHTTVDVERFREIDDTGFGLTPLIREHEKYMEGLLKKLKGNGIGITDPLIHIFK
ncbi:hypothetical protein Tco_1157420 [Tanacetum coccineum]